MSFSIRSVVLEDEINFKFIDPISLDVMNDPVTAADGKVYDRETITAWFQQQRRSGRPLTSPLINTPMVSDVLTPNLELKREIDLFKASKINSFSLEDIKFTLSSDFYQELDRLSHCDLLKQLDLKPPQIIVLGNESHGKSTLLERLIGLPIFPRDKGICTRCPIRVQLRRTNGEKPVISEISIVDRKPAAARNQNNDSTKNAGPMEIPNDFLHSLVNNSQSGRYTQANNRPSTTRLNSNSSPPPAPLPGNSRATAAVPAFYQPTFAALDRMREVIQEKMNLLVAEQPSKIIIDNREIVVQLHLPYCMNLDLLDLPGLVSVNPPNVSQDLPQITKQLALNIIEAEKDFSFFLLVNDIHTHCNQSRGCELIQQCRLEEKTVGIFTKIDVFYSEDGDDVEDLQKHLEGQYQFSFRVKHGWMATASRPSSKSSTSTNISTRTAAAARAGATTPPTAHVGAQELLKLQQMDTAETGVLESRFAELLESQKLGMHVVRQKVQCLYESFIVKEWIPKIREYLECDLKVVLKENSNLGLPIANDPSYQPMLQVIIRQQAEANARMLQGLMGGSNVTNTFAVITQPQLMTIVEQLSTELLVKAESTWLNLTTAEELWNAFDAYHQLIGFTTPGISSAAAAAAGAPSQQPPQNISVFVAPSNCSSNNFPTTVSAAPFAAYHHDHTTNSSSLKTLHRLNELYGLHDAPPATAGITAAHEPSRRTKNNVSAFFHAMLEDATETDGPADPSNEQNWIVHLSIATRAVDEKITRLQLALQRVYLSMTSLLDVNRFVQCFFHTASHSFVSIKPVKIERFGSLQRILHQVITTAFEECKAQLQRWYEEQLVHPLFRAARTGIVANPFPLVIKEYVRTTEGVYCALHWAHEATFHQYPHVLLDQWRTILYEMLERLPMLLATQFSTEEIVTLENCQLTRRRTLERIQANVEVYTALQEFARKAMQNLPESFPVQQTTPHANRRNGQQESTNSNRNSNRNNNRNW